MADDDKHWQNMSPDEQAIVIRQINGAVNGLQFRVQDLEDAWASKSIRPETACRAILKCRRPVPRPCRRPTPYAATREAAMAALVLQSAHGLGRRERLRRES